MPDPLQRALVALDGLSLADPRGFPVQAALAVLDVLKRRGGLEAQDLAATFARRGAGPHPAAALLVGAWFAGNVGRVVEEAERVMGPASRHPEETAAAVAVAVAAARAFEGADPVTLREGYEGAVRSAGIDPAAIAGGIAACRVGRRTIRAVSTRESG